MGFENGKDLDSGDKLRFSEKEREDIKNYQSPSLFYSQVEQGYMIEKQKRVMTLPAWAFWMLIVGMCFVLISQLWIVNTITKIYSLVSYQTGILEQQKKDK